MATQATAQTPLLSEQLDLQNIHRAINVLKEWPEERNKEDLDILVEMLRKTKFLKGRRLGDYLLYQLAREMEYLYVGRGKLVFDYGSYGDMFYIILQGKVGVFLPFAPQTTRKGSEANEQNSLQGNISHIQTTSATLSRLSVLNVDANSFHYRQVAELSKGDTFGELALITNRPRAARIKVLESTHFAMLNRKSFEKILKVIEEIRLDKITAFLNSTPYFKFCNDRTLHKIQYYFSKKIYIKNQVVYKSGEYPKYVYLIFEGEFEMKIIIPPRKNTKNILRNKDEKTASTLKVKFGAKLVGKNLKQNNMNKGNFLNIKILGKGQFFGEEDVILERVHKANVSCKSVRGILLQVSINDFRRSIWSISEVKEYIQEHSKVKGKLIQQRISQLKHFSKNKANYLRNSKKPKTNKICRGCKSPKSLGNEEMRGISEGIWGKSETNWNNNHIHEVIEISNSRIITNESMKIEQNTNSLQNFKSNTTPNICPLQSNRQINIAPYSERKGKIYKNEETNLLRRSIDTNISDSSILFPKFIPLTRKEEDLLRKNPKYVLSNSHLLLHEEKDSLIKRNIQENNQLKMNMGATIHLVEDVSVQSIKKDMIPQIFTVSPYDQAVGMPSTIMMPELIATPVNKNSDLKYNSKGISSLSSPNKNLANLSKEFINPTSCASRNYIATACNQQVKTPQIHNNRTNSEYYISNVQSTFNEQSEAKRKSFLLAKINSFTFLPQKILNNNNNTDRGKIEFKDDLIYRRSVILKHRIENKKKLRNSIGVMPQAFTASGISNIKKQKIMLRK